MRSIDLNADMGEYADETQREIEAALMPLVSSCSIACGGHTGDERTMRHTALLAKKHNVSIGAHPAYPDREGFGRRSLEFEPDKLAQSLKQQVSALASILKKEGITLRHVKPHGALYNDAAKDAGLARLVVEAAGNAIIVGPPGSMIETAARDAGKRFAAEGFVDRLYLRSGVLSPRGTPGAIIEDVDTRAQQAAAIARGDKFDAVDGVLAINVQTLCIHSDSRGAVETACAVRKGLEDEGFTIRPFR